MEIYSPATSHARWPDLDFLSFCFQVRAGEGRRETERKSDARMSTGFVHLSRGSDMVLSVW